jgi:hypothetical protein
MVNIDLDKVRALRELGCTKVEFWDNGALHTLEFASSVVQVPVERDLDLDDETRETIARQFLQERLSKDESELLASA